MQLILCTLATLYVCASAFYIVRQGERLRRAESHLYKLADGLELLKAINKNNCTFDPTLLPKPRVLSLGEIPPDQGHPDLPAEHRIFSLSLRLDDQTKLMYRSVYAWDSGDDSATSQWTPLIYTDRQGKLLELDWGKP